MSVSVHPDEQRRSVLILRAAIVANGITAFVTDDVPEDWVPGSTPHLTVQSDGAARVIKRAAAWPTIRVVARAATATDPTSHTASRHLAIAAQALLLAHPGGSGVSSFFPLLGPLDAPAPETGHPLSWFTVRAAVRAEIHDLSL